MDITKLTIDAPVSRRSLLQGAIAATAGLSLPDLLSHRAACREVGTPTADTAVIFVYLGGGPSQHETFDPKPDAPSEYRGAFQAISTALPGVAFCELAPRLAAAAAGLSVVRTVWHEEASHIALHYVETGYKLRNNANALKGEMPAVGSVAAKMRAPSLPDLPAYVSLPKAFAYSGPHWLGGASQAFPVDGNPSAADFNVRGLALAPNVTTERLTQRRQLRKLTDNAEFVDPEGDVDAAAEFTERGFDLLLGTRARPAFDLNREPIAVRDRYGRHEYGQRLLFARRLVEAGVPFVAVRMGDWDDHDRLPERMTKRMAMFDSSTATLINDLAERGLARKVLVVCMGEFGRTPKINGNAGRDHWPGTNSVLLAGGSFRMGTIVGATDRRGGTPSSAPYRPENVLAMVYRHLGIDAATSFNDHSGRPRYLLEERALISELV